MRPSVYQICDVVEDFFWRVRPRGKPPVDGTFSKLHGFPNEITAHAHIIGSLHVAVSPLPDTYPLVNLAIAEEMW